jgi:hypothetical protein
MIHKDIKRYFEYIIHENYNKDVVVEFYKCNMMLSFNDNEIIIDFCEEKIISFKWIDYNFLEFIITNINKLKRRTKII